MTTPLDEFMIKEYDRIAEAFFALHTQENQMLRYYLTIMTLGATAIGVASQIPKGAIRMTSDSRR